MKQRPFADMIKAHGVILFTERYKECVSFYRDTLELPVWFEKEGLCCLHFGNGYLMIETDGYASTTHKTVAENPGKLRFNVDDVDAAADLLAQRGVDVTLERFDWGYIGTFFDPDGNACGLKNADDPDFHESG